MGIIKETINARPSCGDPTAVFEILRVFRRSHGNFADDQRHIAICKTVADLTLYCQLYRTTVGVAHLRNLSTQWSLVLTPSREGRNNNNDALRFLELSFLPYTQSLNT